MATNMIAVNWQCGTISQHRQQQTLKPHARTTICRANLDLVQFFETRHNRGRHAMKDICWATCCVTCCSRCCFGYCVVFGCGFSLFLLFLVMFVLVIAAVAVVIFVVGLFLLLNLLSGLIFITPCCRCDFVFFHGGPCWCCNCLWSGSYIFMYFSWLSLSSRLLLQPLPRKWLAKNPLTRGGHG